MSEHKHEGLEALTVDEWRERFEPTPEETDAWRDQYSVYPAPNARGMWAFQINYIDPIDKRQRRVTKSGFARASDAERTAELRWALGLDSGDLELYPAKVVEYIFTKLEG
jgi:hypothetical protein